MNASKRLLKDFSSSLLIAVLLLTGCSKSSEEKTNSYVRQIADAYQSTLISSDDDSLRTALRTSFDQDTFTNREKQQEFANALAEFVQQEFTRVFNQPSSRLTPTEVRGCARLLKFTFSQADLSPNQIKSCMSGLVPSTDTVTLWQRADSPPLWSGWLMGLAIVEATRPNTTSETMAQLLEPLVETGFVRQDQSLHSQLFGGLDLEHAPSKDIPVAKRFERSAAFVEMAKPHFNNDTAYSESTWKRFCSDATIWGDPPPAQILVAFRDACSKFEWDAAQALLGTIIERDMVSDEQMPTAIVEPFVVAIANWIPPGGTLAQDDATATLTTLQAFGHIEPTLLEPARKRLLVRLQSWLKQFPGTAPDAQILMSELRFALNAGVDQMTLGQELLAAYTLDRPAGRAAALSCLLIALEHGDELDAVAADLMSAVLASVIASSDWILLERLAQSGLASSLADSIRDAAQSMLEKEQDSGTASALSVEFFARYGQSLGVHQTEVLRAARIQRALKSGRFLAASEQAKEWIEASPDAAQRATEPLLSALTAHIATLEPEAVVRDVELLSAVKVAIQLSGSSARPLREASLSAALAAKDFSLAVTLAELWSAVESSIGPELVARLWPPFLASLPETGKIFAADLPKHVEVLARLVALHDTAQDLMREPILQRLLLASTQIHTELSSEVALASKSGVLNAQTIAATIFDAGTVRTPTQTAYLLVAVSEWLGSWESLGSYTATLLESAYAATPPAYDAILPLATHQPCAPLIKAGAATRAMELLDNDNYAPEFIQFLCQPATHPGCIPDLAKGAGEQTVRRLMDNANVSLDRIEAALESITTTPLSRDKFQAAFVQQFGNSFPLWQQFILLTPESDLNHDRRVDRFIELRNNAGKPTASEAEVSAIVCRRLLERKAWQSAAEWGHAARAAGLLATNDPAIRMITDWQEWCKLAAPSRTGVIHILRIRPNGERETGSFSVVLSNLTHSDTGSFLDGKVFHQEAQLATLSGQVSPGGLSVTISPLPEERRENPHNPVIFPSFSFDCHASHRSDGNQSASPFAAGGGEHFALRGGDFDVMLAFHEPGTTLLRPLVNPDNGMIVEGHPALAWEPWKPEWECAGGRMAFDRLIWHNASVFYLRASSPSRPTFLRGTFFATDIDTQGDFNNRRWSIFVEADGKVIWTSSPLSRANSRIVLDRQIVIPAHTRIISIRLGDGQGESMVASHLRLEPVENP